VRDLPNQTAFVEAALRAALGRTCPTCKGSGRVASSLSVSDFRRQRLPRLDRATALQLRELVRLGRRMCATRIELRHQRKPRTYVFRMERDAELLLSGRLDAAATTLEA
jgi:hypothetical protein